MRDRPTNWLPRRRWNVRTVGGSEPSFRLGPSDGGHCVEIAECGAGRAPRAAHALIVPATCAVDETRPGSPLSAVAGGTLNACVTLDSFTCVEVETADFIHPLLISWTHTNRIAHDGRWRSHDAVRYAFGCCAETD